ncbi:MAG: MBG domain-containing protein, partial [Clostridia bacterium]|nr:MBG domain-containing protein [Clostridia bacterium]
SEDERSNITFEWLYNGEALDSGANPYITNAGLYVVSADFPGNEFVHQYTHQLNITIAKAALPSPDFYGTGGIHGVHTPYIYNGEDYDYTQIKAFNLDGIGITAENYSYTLWRMATPVSYIRNVGYYTVLLTIGSTNYTSYSGEAAVQVAKADLNIIMHAKSVDYLAEAPLFTFGIEAQTNPGATLSDQQTTNDNALAAIQGAGGAATCAYAAGENAGSYAISFNVALTNYNVTVTGAALTVNPIALPTDGIVFEDTQSVYEGQTIAVAAQISDPQITAVYTNNANRNVGIYTVRGVFSKPNYNDYTKDITLTITSAPLVIKPLDTQIVYGSAPPQYTLDEIALRGGDTAAVLVGQAVFEGVYVTGDVAGVYDIFVSGLAADNYTITFEKGALTVAKAPMTGIFSYSGISHTYDGQPKTHPIDLLGYEVNVIYTYYLGAQLLPGAPTDSGIYSVIAYVNAINSNYANTQFMAQMTINTADIAIYFQAEYTLQYDGEAHNVGYEGELPSPETWTVVQTGKNVQNQQFSSFENAGRYNVTTVFSGNPNYNAKTLTTVLIITKRQLTLEITSGAVYNKTNQTPEYSIIGSMVDGDNVGISWKYSMLGYGYEYAVSSVTNAGSYTTYPVSISGNYFISGNPVFTIQKMQVAYAPNYVEYVYGDYIDFVYSSRSFTSGRTSLVHRGFYVYETNESVDVEYYYAGPNVGVYNVTAVKDTANYDFSIPEGTGANRVRVLTRPLTHFWSDSSMTVVYNGALQQPFTVDIGNVISGESVSTQIRSDGNLKDVGDYLLWVELLFAPNYQLDSTTVALEIVKAPLTIRANDKNVVRGTENVNYSASVEGLQGTDTLSSMGRQLVYNCVYLPSTPVGLTLPIAITVFQLPNYEITFITGTLTVLANQYPPVAMANKTFVYDGNMKALTLNQSLPPGATVSFQNNYKTAVGIYNVVATVIFPNGFFQTLAATLVITKATPVLFVEDIVIPYSIVAKLKNNDIIGVAMLNENEVAGSFAWSGDTSLKRDINEYQVIFTPTDAHNFNTASATLNVNGKPVREEALAFDTESVIISENSIFLTEATNLTLSEEYADAELYLDGQEVNFITLAATGEYKIEIKYGGNLVYSKTFNVTMKTEDEDDPVIPPGEGVFEISGGAFEENGIIRVEEGGCIIRLKEGYESMRLFQDNSPVSFIVLNGSERSVKIQVVYDNILVYSRSFNVAAPPEEEPEQPPTDNLLWLKVVGGVVGGLALSVGLFFVIRKLIIKRKKVYNPYDAVEKKNNKKKKKLK